MTYKAPRRFAAARPHLAAFMTDDPAAIVRDDLARRAADRDAPTLTERLSAEALRMRKLTNQQYIAINGFEGLAWEIAATDVLQSIALAGTIYVRGSGTPSTDGVPMSALDRLTGAVHIELDDVTTKLPSGAMLHGVTFIRTPAAIAAANADLPAIQIVLWPFEGEGDWISQRRYGHWLSADGSGTLGEAVARGTNQARAKLVKEGVAGMFNSHATTDWNDALAGIISMHAQTLVAVLAGELPAPAWQDGIPPYLLAKTEGAKGAAAVAALLRRGFVRENRIAFG